MSFWDKITGVGGDLWSIGTGIGRVASGDWTGFTSIHSGVKGLFEDKDAMGKAMQGYSSQSSARRVNFQRYKDSVGPVSSAGRVSALGDVDNIPAWSRNQAVAMYYLNMINKITTQGSPRKGA